MSYGLELGKAASRGIGKVVFFRFRFAKKYAKNFTTPIISLLNQ
jgi:hypothetical protein